MRPGACASTSFATDRVYRSRPLDDDADVSRFSCGEPSLDEWLVEHARTAEAKRTARTFVWVGDDGDVAGYYAITAHLLDRGSLPLRLGRGDPSEIPAVLLAKLALRKDLHGQGLGAELLADALDRIVGATKVVAARYVVVDAIDDGACDFYAHHGFLQVPAHERRLVRRVSDVAAALGRA